jgi:hypothetical protein
MLYSLTPFVSYEEKKCLEYGPLVVGLSQHIHPSLIFAGKARSLLIWMDYSKMLHYDIELITTTKSFIVPVHLSNQALMLNKYCCNNFYSIKPVFPLSGISVQV